METAKYTIFIGIYLVIFGLDKCTGYNSGGWYNNLRNVYHHHMVAISNMVVISRIYPNTFLSMYGATEYVFRPLQSSLVNISSLYLFYWLGS